MAEYSLMRYWRYVFTPLLTLLIVVGWLVLFMLSPNQLVTGALPDLSEKYRQMLKATAPPSTVGQAVAGV